MRTKITFHRNENKYTYILYKVSRSWTIGRDILFSAEDYTNMSYYNCCGIRPKHSNISKRVGEEVITICVVLDQNHGNVMFYQLVSNL
jgi:hypothetical protein